MLSEHIRFFLSQYVRITNKRHGRKGTKVLERFQKYIVHAHADYERVFKFISNQERIPIQENPKYRADEKQYDLEKEIIPNSILKGGNAMYEGLVKGDWVMRCIRILRPKDSVLRNFLQSPNSNPSQPNSS